MMIASIDISKGKAVTIDGATQEIKVVGEVEELIPRFALPGEVTVFDLDAAMGAGENRTLITDLVKTYPCRVGGGIATVEDARYWLDAGAEKIIVDGNADPAIFDALPKARVLAALDVKDGAVVTDWGKTTTGQSPVERVTALKEKVGGPPFSSSTGWGPAKAATCP